MYTLASQIENALYMCKTIYKYSQVDTQVVKEDTSQVLICIFVQDNSQAPPLCVRPESQCVR